ncbi:anaphase-promoting complex subunit 1 [Trichoplusia ni]|uniref:Anaphase-promoting complex subunit 1 n=1 Tax=Trichoplusia ni TaxID=7111 RepID=A0A7E5WM81_TRINI|nr:anaphase-promoting complex subunit 1 [Trichoplusia ni]
MIAASEPLEFVPHGRTVLAKHPGQIYSKHNTSASENSLLYKLTNFAIKDESLLEAKEAEEQEWWCIREVYYKGTDDFEEDPQPKDMKFEGNSFRAPSQLRNDFNISIKSELLTGTKKMDTEGLNSAGTSRGGSANSSSNMSKKFNLNSGPGKNSKDKLNPKTDSCYEEELYVKGCTAVWSKGLISTPATKLSEPEHRETIACYTIENPIKHAAFCNFHVDIKNTMLIDALNTQIGDVKKNIKIEDTTEHIQTKIMPAILLIDSKCLKVYANEGREYITSLPFQVKKVWPMKYGVLLEKEATPAIHNSMLPNSFIKLNDSQNSTFSRSKSNFPFNMSSKLRAESMSGFDTDVALPTCFSLTHPLDEVTPILMKSPSQGLQYYNDGDLQIIFVSSNPSIILLYDWKLGTHSLWRIRKTVRDECLSMCPNMNSTTTVFSQSYDYVGSPMQSQRNATSWATGLGSPYQSKKMPGTPTMSRSRINSPMASVFHQQGLSPHASIGQASCASMLGNNGTQNPPSLPLYPDICLDHIWTDSQTIRRDPIESLSDMKTFLHTDLVGHDYLCFIVKVGGVSRLQIVRLQRSHSHGRMSKTNLMVGAVSTVLAKDAVVLDHLNMIALIDEAGNIILQSGNYVVGKVHVGGVLARLIDSPYTKRATFQSPFPRRSSLLPSRCNETSNFDDSALHLLSPVPHTSAARIEQKESLGLSGLCDAAGSRLTLQFEAGPMYRISLPPLTCSTLVTRCYSALRAILPKDVSMQVIIKWYGVRNAPGTQDLTPEQEWSMFSNLLFSLIGYDIERLHTKQNDDVIEHVEVASKKQRTSSDGTQDDWDYLLNSKMHKAIGHSLTMLKLPIPNCESYRKGKRSSTEPETPSQFNTNSILFPYVLQVLYSLHIVYEEIKLNTLLWSNLKPLSGFLYQVSKDLKLDSYVNHYWLDFPTDLNLEYDDSSQISDVNLKKICQPVYFSREPPNIYSYLNSMLKDVDVGYYPYLADVNTMSRDIIELLSLVGCGRSAGPQLISCRDGVAASSTPRARRAPGLPAEACCHAVITAVQKGITLRDVDNLPPALGLLLLTIFSRCKSSPPADWPPAAYNLVMREDLAHQAEVAHTMKTASDYMEFIALEVLEKDTVYTMAKRPVETPRSNPEDADVITGMEHLNTQLLALLYPRDHRMTEVINLLQSSIPVTINLTQRPEVSDHDFIEEQEKYLYAISTRTMALPIARGMACLRTAPCAATEGARVPRVCVWGRWRGRGAPGPDAGPAPAAWPAFHNGAAAGLALVPLSGFTIDSEWVIYNKPRGTAEMSTEHAGFLMGLGLNGHLRDMPFMNIYEYLVKCNEMISVGLLLGLAATYRGTMDVQATKMMSIHLEPLLPPTSIELDIQQNILVAALLGVGLIYQGTAHTHYAQVLLNEIGKPPGPEMENCVEREGYALAAGLALGLVCAAAARHTPLAHVAHRLRTYMLGGDKLPLSGSQKEKYKQGSFAIREGATVNLDVTSPGATLALGLIYLRSNNAALAAWLEPPSTAYQLDFVRPDLLMLRVIARGLVLWDSIEPTEEWVESQVPATIKPYCFVKPTEDNIDYEAMNQAYCNIIAGACFAMGLRFAGSGDEEARDTALHYARLFIAVGGKSVAELAGRSTLEACLCVCLLAAGMITCGRGDVCVLRVCRRLRARTPGAAPAPPAAAPLSHGGQMAVHCTIGLLFLGGGRATLSTTPTAVAALLAAFFPKFPTHSEDNRYHLQAFRHLYVLAVEARLILPRDINTEKLCYAHIQVIDLNGVVKEMKAPCIIPELSTLKEVKINDPRYWPITFQRDRNWDQLKLFLEYSWCIDIKQRAGCLSYIDDPQGFLTILAQTLTLDKANIWSTCTDNIELFTNDDKIRNFVKQYLVKDVGTNVCADCLVLSKKKKNVKEVVLNRQCQCRKYTKEEKEHLQTLGMVTYECVVKDILCALPIWTTFLKIIKTMKPDPSSFHVWQIKLLLSQIENHNRRSMNEMKVDGQESQNEPLISSEFTLAIKQKVSNIFDSWEGRLTPFLRKYLGLPSSRRISTCDDDVKKILSGFLVYHDLPKGALKDVMGEDTLSVLLALEGLSVNACSKLATLLA